MEKRRLSWLLFNVSVVGAVVADVYMLPRKVAEDLETKRYAIACILDRELRIITPKSYVHTRSFSDFYLSRLSDDGTQLIAYSAMFDHDLPSTRIRIIGNDGRMSRELPVDLTTVRSASLSPNGDFIAFIGACKQNHARGIQYARFSTDDPTMIEALTTRDVQLNSETLAWSDDSRRIVYGSGQRVKIFDIGTGKSTVFVDGTNPGWSPDGKWISFRTPGGFGAIISRDGQRRRIIESKHKVIGALRWSPDSRYLFGIVEWDKVDSSLTCYGNTRLIIYRLSDGASFPFYNPCGLKSEFFSWISDFPSWETAH
jgi:WD40 repeat protein